MHRLLIATILILFSGACLAQLDYSPTDGWPHPGIGKFNVLSALRTVSGIIFPDRPRSIQSFGAIGDGIADDTTAVSRALNSGTPLFCRGTFVINSLVTITNTTVNLNGSGKNGCVFILNSAQSMIYATLRGVAIQASPDTFTMRNVLISVNAQITSVSGPAQTAALYITYPGGNNGTSYETVLLEDLLIRPTTSSNYIINGIYLNDASVSRLNRINIMGNRAVYQPNSRAMVFDGSHAPVLFTVNDSLAFYVGRGIYLPQVATSGWQGIRVHAFDCYWCDIIIEAEGSLDGSSDQVDFSSVEGTYNKWGILVSNTIHAFINNNYMFADKISGQIVQATPVCIQFGVTINTGGVVSYPGFEIANNQCDGIQYSGATTRYGIIVNGFSLAAPMNGVLGSNIISNMEVGESLFAGTADVLVYPPKTLSVSTPLQNLSTATYNSRVVSSAY